MLTDTLKRLTASGHLRQLDYQFGRFIAQKATAHAQQMGFIATLVSAELGRGHICLPLEPSSQSGAELAAKLGLFGEEAAALALYLDKTDWRSVLDESGLTGKKGEALPFMFDGKRLYLHRYWHYEVALAGHLKRLGDPVQFRSGETPRLRALLDNLFARDYHWLFNALTAPGRELSQANRQQLVCDYLDVINTDIPDWQAIDHHLLQVKHVSDLVVLDTLVPIQACLNWQKVAASVALSRRFAVISGGPGTGKTTTVTKLLTALIAQAEEKGDPLPSIRLVAPTGKAAARLTESIGKAVDSLAVEPALKAAIPTQSSTLHRLLGALPDSAEFRHNRDNPLHLDILVVDEASMVDLPLMYKLTEALPGHARLILLGDKDQLSSVEAGAVLGDICSFHQYGYSRQQSQVLAELTGFTTLSGGATATDNPVSDSLCMLQKSYRFDARSGIGQLARAVNRGDIDSIEPLWQKNYDDIRHYPLSSREYNQILQVLVGEYSRYLQRASQAEKDPITGEAEPVTSMARAALNLFSQCRLLCAVREGDFGVTGLNQRIERALAARKLIQVQDELWYHGRPVMVTRNDHNLGLYNGDVGLCLWDSERADRRLKVYFEQPDGTIKGVLPSRVPQHDTAYAMTIHKSQGSEFDYTLMVLPPDFSPILTRELIYTGITRAKKRLALYADLSTLKRGIRIRTERASGLTDRLKG